MIMRRYHPFFFVLFILISAGSSDGRELDPTTASLKIEAYQYYYGNERPVDYTQALYLYRQAAERGDAEAQYIVGGMYYTGKGIDPDKKKGFKWLISAAEQGKTSPESLAIIGSMLLSGQEIPQNYLEAKKWLTQAVKQGSLTAQRDLAYLYYHGLGGNLDYKKALELYEKAALQGDTMAQSNAGLMYATGTGTNRDKARGYAWYSLAASSGNAFAIKNRNNLMLDMTWEELNQAQALSFELYRRIEKIHARDSFAPMAPQ